MKNSFILSALAVAAIALVSCNKEQDFNKVEKVKGIPFEILAGTVDTKTVNADMSTTWAADDQICLFHAEKDAEASTAVYDGAFTASGAGASVAFSGNLASALDGEKSYDWYAVYPYSSAPKTANAFDYVTIGSSASGAQTQEGNDSKAHLAGVNYPLWGKKKNVAAATKPAIAMNQMAAIIKVKVTNKTTTPITVTNVQFTSSAESELIGSFRVDLSGNTPAFTASTTNAVATLNVTGAAAIAGDADASYFMGVKPFSATAGSKLTITVTTTELGVQELSNIVPTKFDFVAGKIYTLEFNFTNKTVNLAEFKYNDASWLTAQGITLPGASASTNLEGAAQTVTPIVITSTDGSTKTRVFNAAGAYDLRIYNGGSLTVGATNDCFISKITIAGNNISNLGLTTANTWTGKQVCVNLPATGTANVNTVNVFYQACEATDHLLAVPVSTFSNVAYDAISQDIVFYQANVDDMVVSSSSDGYTGNSIVGNTITVNFSANSSTSSRSIVVNVSSVQAGVNQDITITQLGAPASISTLSDGNAGTVTAQVAALTTNGFVIADNTGAIFVYKSGQGVTIGQTVTVSGTVGNYNKCLQFPSSCTVSKGDAGSYSYGAATSYTSTEISAWNSNASNRLASYVTMTGVVKKNGSNFDLIVGGGSTANATLYSPLSAHTSNVADGDNITVTGYAVNVVSSKCGVIPTAVVNNETTPKLVYTDVTGVAAAGVTNSTLDVQPFRITGWTPVVTRTGCVSAASINEACTTVTYSVSNNESSSAQSGTIVVTFQKTGESDVAYTINVAQVGKASGTSYIYTFKSKSWTARRGDSDANWTSGQDGSAYSNNGVQVTTTTTGANATSPVSFTGISRIVVHYNTNKNAGAGSIKIKVGTNDEKTNAVSYSGSADGRSADFTTTFDYATKQSGSVKITVDTTTNSLFITSIEIIADSLAE